jgi:hypothetical protein
VLRDRGVALPRALWVYIALVAAQWAYAAWPGPPETRSIAEFVLWLAVDALLLGLLVRGSFAAWGILVVFTVLAALLLASGAGDPTLPWAVLFGLTLGRLAALVAPGTWRHLRRGPPAAP